MEYSKFKASLILMDSVYEFWQRQTVSQSTFRIIRNQYFHLRSDEIDSKTWFINCFHLDNQALLE